MGRYISWDQLQVKYGAVTKSRGKDESAPFIVGAEDEIDARVSQYYSVPFTPVPGLITNMCLDLAWAQMNISNVKVSDPIFKRIDMLLKGIADRTIALTVSGSPLTAPSLVALTTSGHKSSFGMDETTRFHVDSGWQQQYASDRGDPI